MGGKRKGKGRGKGARKKRRQMEEGDEPPKKKGNEKAAAKEAAKAAAEAARREEELKDEERRRKAAARRAKPGFSKLLEAFGVSQQPSEDEGSDGSEGSEDEEDEAEAEGPEGPEGQDGEEGGPDVSQLMEAGEGEEEEIFEDADPEEDDEEEEEPVDLSGEQDSGLDFFERFWEDPPQALDKKSSGSTARATGVARFRLPELDRCEAHSCEVEALVKSLESGGKTPVPETLSKSWSYFRLAPGLRKNWEALLDALKDKKDFSLGSAEGAFFLCLHVYLDVFFPQQNHLNARALRALYALHVVDHLRKARGEDPGHPGQAEKGFTTARVLVLCPFRSVCYEFVKLLMALMPEKKQVKHKDRFEEDFGAREDDSFASKPADYQHLFGGNSDDRFRLGIALWKKAMRLYAPFHRADILICSPLGLRQITGAEGERRRDYDFLSSVELCIVDRADVLRMQNWEHVQEVMQVVNRKPQGLGSIDISCLRPQFADGRAREFRQTVVTSNGQSLDADALFKLSCAPAVSSAPKEKSLAARLRAPQLGRSKKGRTLDLNADEDEETGWSLQMLKSMESKEAAAGSCRGIAKLAAFAEGAPLREATAFGISRQFFLHTPCESLAQQSDRLFETFETRYWRPLGSSLEGLLVVATTYYNFLRLRRFLREEGASFSSIFEYSTPKAVGHARQHFFQNERRLLLVTERFLWYRRFRLKGANYVLFYGVPQTAEIYEEVLGAVRVPSQCNSMCLFTKHDAFALERIVGHERAKNMLTSTPGKVFVYS